uniref:Uncharacterized protein n=1 Tax=Oryza brachyantha TaxID=4533 RepID=J3LSF0_ORYBR
MVMLLLLMVVVTVAMAARSGPEVVRDLLHERGRETNTSRERERELPSRSPVKYWCSDGALRPLSPELPAQKLDAVRAEVKFLDEEKEEKGFWETPHTRLQLEKNRRKRGECVPACRRLP